jgi:transposase
MASIQEQVRHEVVGMLLSGTRVSDISKSLKVHLSTVYRIKNKFETTGNVDTSKRSGRPRNVVTNKLKTAIKGRVQRNPERSIRRMASELKCSDRSVRRAMNEMHMKSVAIKKTFLLTENSKKKRLNGCKKILNILKTAGPRKVFIDEKIFTVDRDANSRNDRVIQCKEVPAGTWKSFRTKHPASIMVCCAVGDDGERPHFMWYRKGKL